MSSRALNVLGFLAFLSPLLTAVYVAAAPHRVVPRAASTIQVPIAGSALSTDGRTFTISGTVNLSVSDAAPIPIPTPIPGPGAVVISSVVLASGAPITQAAGGEIIFVKGSGMGAGGTIKVAGQACAVIDWAPWQISCKLPVVATTQTGPVVVSPTGINPGSGLNFSILATAPMPGPTPTPLPPPVPVPGKRVEFPLGSGWLWQEGRIPGWAPHGPTSQHVEKP